MNGNCASMRQHFSASQEFFSCWPQGSGDLSGILNNMLFITLPSDTILIIRRCGILHLGPNAFIAIGAYTRA